MRLASLSLGVVLLAGWVTGSAHAQIPQILPVWPISENLAIADKIQQVVIATFSAEEEKETNKEDQEKNKQQDPNAGKVTIEENAGNPKINEFPPYVDEEMRKELEKERPDIPTIEGLIKKVWVFDSKTIDTKNGEAADRSSDGITEKESGTLEKLQMQTLIVYENSRALARRTLDLLDKADKDTETMRKNAKDQPSTGAVQKDMSSIIFRTHQLLNEISALRNSYLEINAINTIQGTEAPQGQKSIVDGALETVTGGLSR